MDSVVMVTDLLRSLFLLQSFNFSGCSILIGSTDVKHIVSLQSLEASVDISRKDTADDVAQVGHIVDVR